MCLIEKASHQREPQVIHILFNLRYTNSSTVNRFSITRGIFIKRGKGSFVAVTILLCYAHQDERMVSQLKNHLSLLEHNGLIALWDYGNIRPGAEWEQEIDKHLDEAQIILLLISSSFLLPVRSFSGWFERFSS